LQEPENKRKLRRPHSPVNTLDAQLKRHTAVPMGLTLTSLDWAALSEYHRKANAAKQREEQEEQQLKDEKYQEEELRTIDVVSPHNDRVDEYYFEGTELFKVKSNESYDKEDRDLAASLRRNAAATAATVARK
jgi:hypothetical protein